ncbi:MAG: transglycosylase SLT domain-containing protein [Leptospira sp.]|nr:transglycosylase SLT domain-containing protein [Leptospira sp.]
MKKQSQKIKKITAGIPFKKRVISALFILSLFQLSNDQVWSRMPFATQKSENRVNEKEFVQLYIQEVNPKISKKELEILSENVMRQSQNLEFSIKSKSIHLNKVDFLLAVIQTESRFHKKARSHKNAQGYMQLMPKTAEWMYAKSGKKWEPSYITKTDVNLEIGITYMNYLVQMMGSLEKATLAYNAGPTAVRKWGGVSAYWKSIQKNYNNIQEFRRKLNSTI